MDPQIASLVERAERYAQASGLALSTVSLKILNDGKRLDALKSGSVGCTLRRLADAKTKLSELESQLPARATEASA